MPMQIPRRDNSGDTGRARGGDNAPGNTDTVVTVAGWRKRERNELNFLCVHKSDASRFPA